MDSMIKGSAKLDKASELVNAAEIIITMMKKQFKNNLSYLVFFS